MRDAPLKRVTIETDMRIAIENNGFDVVYQPIVDLRSEQIIGMEALARWEHPTYGPISPLDFIPIAEECGLIIPLGKWILEQSCRRAREWQDLYECVTRLSITVNISSRQLQDDRLFDMVRSALAESRLPPNSLVLEITEGTMLVNTEATINRLTKLKSLGVRLAIDDFGTGFRGN